MKRFFSLCAVLVMAATTVSAAEGVWLKEKPVDLVKTAAKPKDPGSLREKFGAPAAGAGAAAAK